MTPQSPFMVLAPIAAGREADLRTLLASMNAAPGMADADNAVLPFGQFGCLHYARLVILEDATLGDFAVHGMTPPRFPKQLAFMGDCDGPAHEFLTQLARRAGEGVRRIFAHCEDFDPGDDLRDWLLKHDIPVAANYVNWLGRTVLQIRQESALQRALSARLASLPARIKNDALQLRRELVAYADAEMRAGRLRLTLAQPTPLGWRIANCLHLLALPLFGLIMLPLLLVLAPFAILLLRRREKSDPEICPRPDPAALQALREIEDRDVTNQFSALGAVKPGAFRGVVVKIVLVLINYACRHVFNRGHLGRVRTIHFARWAFIDRQARIVFTSNYDGSHEAYMDDFINKVAWGLNLVFSNGIGWPRTDWLIKRGARIEQRFKYYQRRHQIPSQVWYKAYPGLTTLDMIRNQRIRHGFEQASMTEAEAIAWLRLL